MVRVVSVCGYRQRRTVLTWALNWTLEAARAQISVCFKPFGFCASLLSMVCLTGEVSEDPGQGVVWRRLHSLHVSRPPG